MLSRIAESLYWLGRHVERADCTARILDTYLHLLPTGSWATDHQVIRSLVDSMGLSGDEEVEGADSGNWSALWCSTPNELRRCPAR